MYFPPSHVSCVAMVMKVLIIKIVLSFSMHMYIHTFLVIQLKNRINKLASYSGPSVCVHNRGFITDGE